MLGWIICRDGDGVILEEQEVGGMRVLVLHIPRQTGWRQRRRLRKMLGELARRGVRRAVVQGGTVPELAEFGIRPVDSFPLRRALLPQLLRWVDREWQLGLDGAAVMLRSDVSDAAAWQAALALSRQVRYVHLDTGPGQSLLEERLRRAVGLGRGGAEPVLGICLGRQSGGGRPALHLGCGCGARQRLALWTPQRPEGEEGLLCALFQAEKLQIEDIQIRFVEFRA